jgi:hypothetical protein
MIRYKFTEADLISDINANDKAQGHKQPWLTKAQQLTRELKKNPRKKITSQWGTVKRVYTNRQSGKCAFCERLLGNHELAAGEFDVEHFRPKNAVKPWPTEDVIADLRLPSDFPRHSGKGKGYRFLAYHHLNYASACKTCNSRLKGSYFPIAGKHRFTGTDPVRLHKQEKPYLIYPLGDFDVNPEDVIDFEGYRATPVHPPKSGYEHDRARVVIAFFRLNDERDDLMFLRAKQLDNVFTKLELWNATRGKGKREEIWRDIQRLSREENDHAGCVRSLLRLYGHPDDKPVPATRNKALENLQLARDYVRSQLKLPRAG